MAIVSDQIGDLITRIRNACMVGHSQCRVPFSQLKMRLLEILKQEHFIQNFEKNTPNSKKVQTEIIIDLKYTNKKPVIQKVIRISKPGIKRYVKKNSLPYVYNGMGIAIVSTSQGLMTDRQARKLGVGGEVLLHIW